MGQITSDFGRSTTDQRRRGLEAGHEVRIFRQTLQKNCALLCTMLGELTQRSPNALVGWKWGL